MDMNRRRKSANKANMSRAWCSSMRHKSLETETLCLYYSLHFTCIFPEKSIIGPKIEKLWFSFLICIRWLYWFKSGDCFVVVCVWQFAFTVLSASLICIFPFKMVALFHITFHCILHLFCFLSFNSFSLIRHAYICEGQFLEEAKSLKVLFTKGVLGNASLDNGRINVHPLTPREFSRNLSGDLGSWYPFSLR